MNIKNLKLGLANKVHKEVIILCVMFFVTFSMSLSYMGIGNQGFNDFDASDVIVSTHTGKSTELSAKASLNRMHKTSGLHISASDVGHDLKVNRQLAASSHFDKNSEEHGNEGQSMSESNVDSMASLTKTSNPEVENSALTTQNSVESSPQAKSTTGNSAASVFGQSSGAAINNQQPSTANQANNPVNLQVSQVQNSSPTLTNSAVESTPDSLQPQNIANNDVAANTSNQSKPTLNILEQETFYDDPVVCPPLTNFPEDWREGAAAIQRQYGCVL